MKQLRTAAGIVCFLLITASLNGQTVRSENADVIVLMDTSGTVLPYHEVINERVLQSIISKFIRIGDSFHLLSFNAEARYEMSQKISTEADLSRVVSRFMLLYQLGQSADFLSGIHFAQEYMTKLPSPQPKILIVISDGIFNPPESSPYRQYTGEQVKTALATSAAAIRAEGWKVYYVKLPFPSDAVIKDLDGTFYAGKLDSTGNIDRSGVGAGGASASASGSQQTGGTAANRSIAASNANTASAAGNTGATSTGTASETDSTKNTQKNSVAGADGRNTKHTGQVGGASNQTTASVPLTNANKGLNNTRTNTENKAGTAGSNALAETGGTAAGTTHVDEVQTGTPAAGIDTAHTDKTPTDTAAADTANANSAIGNTNEAADQPVQHGIKEYTDVSQAFTENLGIETSDLPEEGSIVFNDEVLPIPDIILPEHIETSSPQLELPVRIVNKAAEPVDITLQSIVVETDGKTYRQEMSNLSARVLPQIETGITARIHLPENIRTTGEHRSTIRLDFVQKDKHFSQAAAVLLTIKPSFFQSFITGNVRWIVLAGSAILLLLILILFIRSRVQEPAPYAARRLGQTTGTTEGQQSGIRQRGTAQQMDFQKEARSTITGTDKRYYPEQQTNRTDPRESLNSFSSQTAAAAAETQKETASQMNYLAQEHSRNMEGRFALLNSTETRLSRHPNFSQNYYGRISTKPSQSGMTELFVYNQTTSIGKRNIHVMKPGSSMSIGGSKNDSFLIFLVPFPANLAQIHYDGGEYRLSILKSEYFPYETSSTIYNCIGRDITIVSKKGYHVTFTFRGYEDPMIKLNTILTSINYIAENTKSV